MVSLCLSALGIFGDIDFTKYIFTSSFRPGSSKEGSDNEVVSRCHKFRYLGLLLILCSSLKICPVIIHESQKTD